MANLRGNLDLSKDAVKEAGLAEVVCMITSLTRSLLILILTTLGSTQAREKYTLSNPPAKGFGTLLEDVPGNVTYALVPSTPCTGGLLTRCMLRALYVESKMMKTIQDFRDRKIVRPTKEALANAFTFLEGAPAEDHGLRKQVSLPHIRSQFLLLDTVSAFDEG